MISFFNVAKMDEMPAGKIKSFVIDVKHIPAVNHDGATSW